MRKERDILKVSQLETNNGQLGWLPKNPRQWTQTDIDRTKASIQEDTDFLEDRPLLVCPGLSGKYVVFGGNLRLTAARSLKLKEVPVVVYCLDEGGPEQDEIRETIKRRAMKDNGSFGSWDFDLLANEWDDLPLTDWGVPAWEGEGEGEKDTNEAQEDDFDEDEQEIPARCKLGDIWQLGDHRLMCGDSTDWDTVTKLLGGARVNMVLTDPPYGINLDGDNSKRGKVTSLMKGGYKLKSFVDDSTIYAIRAFEIVQKLNVEKQVWFGANYYCHSIPESNNWLIWDKRVEEKMSNTNSDCELAWVKDGHNSCRIFRHLWNGLIKESERGDKRVHPTQKPIALMAFCIERYAQEAETILDLFGGSGTTLIASEQLGRQCYMMELDPYYCDVIIARWEKFTGQSAVKV